MTNEGKSRVQERGASFEEVLAQGVDLLDRDPQGALDRAEILLRWGPQPRTFELAAAAMRRLGELADAEQSELSGIKASFSVRELEEAALAGRESREDVARAILEQFLSNQPENLLALTMAAELDIQDWQLDRAAARLRKVLARAPSFLRAIMAELDPVHLRVGEEAVKENYRPALPELVKGKFDAVGCSPELNAGIRHPGNFPVTSTHLSTSFW